MAPALSRSLYTTPLTSLPLTPTRLSPLRTASLPRADVGLRTGVSWSLEKRCSRFAVKCDAAVAEKETAEEGSGEKFEYQAEVRSSSKKSFDFYFWVLLNLVKVWAFRWQVSRLLDLIVHSLYSHKEVFLRELVRYVCDTNRFDLVKNWFEFVCFYVPVMRVMRWIRWGSWVWQSLLCLEMVEILRFGLSLILITALSPLRNERSLTFFLLLSLSINI